MKQNYSQTAKALIGANNPILERESETGSESSLVTDTELASSLNGEHNHLMQPKLEQEQSKILQKITKPVGKKKRTTPKKK